MGEASVADRVAEENEALDRYKKARGVSARSMLFSGMLLGIGLVALAMVILEAENVWPTSTTEYERVNLMGRGSLNDHALQWNLALDLQNSTGEVYGMQLSIVWRRVLPSDPTTEWINYRIHLFNGSTIVLFGNRRFLWPDQKEAQFQLIHCHQDYRGLPAPIRFNFTDTKTFMADVLLPQIVAEQPRSPVSITHWNETLDGQDWFIDHVNVWQRFKKVIADPDQSIKSHRLPSAISAATPHIINKQAAKAEEAEKSIETEVVIKGCKFNQPKNGQCDDECNNVDNEWDGGDCCGTHAFYDHFETPKCKTGPPVLLLHGASWRTMSTGDMSRQFSDVNPAVGAEVLQLKMWGALPTALGHFTNHLIFNSHNTYDLPWSDPVLQRAYYNKALQVQKQGGHIFAHSMACLILAGACLDQHLCQVKWYAVGCPLRGAKMLMVPFPVRGYAVDLNNTGVQSMRPDYRDIGSGILADVVQEHQLLRGSLCGYSAFGTGGWTGSEFTSLQMLLHRKPAWDFETDGVVASSECAAEYRFLPTERAKHPDFSSNKTHKFLGMLGNHQDIAGVVFSNSSTIFQIVVHWYADRLTDVF